MFKKIIEAQSWQIFNRYVVSDACEALELGRSAPREAVEVMVSEQLHRDAITFLAHALPVREAILWGYKCLSSRSNEWSPDEQQALEIGKAWALQPTELRRVQASNAVNRIGLDAAPCWLAQAVVWNGSDSINDPDAPDLFPPPFLYARAIVAAITVAAVIPAWDGMDDFIANAVLAGIGVAEAQVNLVD